MFTYKYMRLAVTLIMIATVSFFWYTRLDELYYHTFASSELIDLGNAVDFASKENSIKANTYVSVTGVLGNKAATLRGLRAGSLRYGRYQVRNLIGSKLFLEFDESKYLPSFNQFTRVAVQGRLVSFGPNSELESVRDFYKEYYKSPVDEKAMIIIVDETPKTEFRYAVLFIITLLLFGISLYFSYLSIKNYSSYS